MKKWILCILFFVLRVGAQETAGTVTSSLPETAFEKRLSFEKHFLTVSLSNNFASELNIEGLVEVSSATSPFQIPMVAESALSLGVDYYIPWFDELGLYIGGRYEGERQIQSASFDFLGTVSTIDLDGATPTLSLIVLRAGLSSYLHPRWGVFLGPNLSLPNFKPGTSALDFSGNGNSSEMSFSPGVGFNAGIQYIAWKHLLFELSYNSTVIGETYEFLSSTGGSSVLVETTGKVEGILFSLRYMVL